MGRNRRVKLFSEISGIEEIVGDDGRDWYGRLEERDFVDWIMSQLDEEGKEYLRYFLDGYTTKEVAQLWNWSDKKMSSWARRFVSIPQWCDCCMHSPCDHIRPLSRFNPTMVRLLRVSSRQSICASNWFQSHNGAIAAFYGRRKWRLVYFVSIPQWCDCCAK